MARLRAMRRNEEAHTSRDRWLVSYADFITLLFAFFVVMYALSSVNEGKYRVLSQSLNQAFGSGEADERSEGVMLVTPPSLKAHNEAVRLRAESAAKRRERKMRDLAASLQSVLAPLDAQGPLQITQTAKAIVVEIGASALFAPADAKLEPQAVQILSAASKVLAGSKNAIRIEGHTDATPIATPVYPSNWELSAARASAVAKLFVENGVQGSRVGVTGYAANRPVDTNTTAEGRARNRRVTLVVLAEMEDNGAIVEELGFAP
ncbi:MAG TPA: flagellar motor protein MotD [Burkholderiales bacterium]|nr:flagellar motor protein MotD [Burkholderiales bacterium]